MFFVASWPSSRRALPGLLAFACVTAVLLIGWLPSGIIGGRPVLKYPFLAAIEQGGSFICGGTLIAPKHVLTAAHCIDKQASAYSVVLYTQTLDSRASSQDNNCFQRIQVSQTICHAEYDSDSNVADICVLTLASSPRCVDEWRLPKLATRATARANRDAIATGWGKTEANSGSTVTLIEALVLLHSPQRCKSLIGRKFLDPQMLCAGTEGFDTCQGDSGGPLFLYEGTTRTEVVLLGVVSWGYGCGKKNSPGMYTNVGLYAPWVNSVLQGTMVSPPPPPPVNHECNNACTHAGDGECDDGGPGSAYEECEVGSDCKDCGRRDSDAGTCTNDCKHSSDRECDDGGPGAAYSNCALGTDCRDCGPRDPPQSWVHFG